MVRSFHLPGQRDPLTFISAHYIVCNVSARASGAERTQQVDYVAEHLPSRAAILVRLLVKQLRTGALSRTELEVMSLLREGPRRITELAELEGIAQPTMTLLVKRLESKGWVTRGRVPEDGRVVIASLTDAGAAAQQQFRARFLAAMRSNLRELSDREVRALAAATQTLSAFVDDQQQRAGRTAAPGSSARGSER
jgi:DNA-binding MarR family transcriptional regulator